MESDEGFTDTAFIDRIHRIIEGSTGETWKLMCRVIEHAVKSGSLSLSPFMLNQVEWVAPSERRKGLRE